MSLTATDLQAIRSIMREELKPLEGRVLALENDAKDIYFMISDTQKSMGAMQQDIGELKTLVSA